MDINILFGVGLTLALSYFIYRAFRSRQPTFIPQRTGLLVAQDTGKTKHNQSKTGDASLSIERTRRRAIQSVGREFPSKIKESRTSAGSTTGAVESFMLSSICPRIIREAINILYDAGCASAEFCDVLADDGRGETYDGGNAASTNVCNPPVQFETLRYDAGVSSNEFCDIIDDEGVGESYDGGNAYATSCE